MLLEIAPLEKGCSSFGNHHMLKNTPEYRAQAREIMWYQAGFVLIVSLIVEVFFQGGLAALYGGGVAWLATWHLYRSVFAAKGDRVMLFKAAGVRFALLLLALGIGFGWFGFQALYLVIGMATVYVVMYAKSLWKLLRQMKGESIG